MVVIGLSGIPRMTGADGSHVGRFAPMSTQPTMHWRWVGVKLRVEVYGTSRHRRIAVHRSIFQVKIRV